MLLFNTDQIGLPVKSWQLKDGWMRNLQTDLSLPCDAIDFKDTFLKFHFQTNKRFDLIVRMDGLILNYSIFVGLGGRKRAFNWVDNIDTFVRGIPGPAVAVFLTFYEMKG